MRVAVATVRCHLVCCGPQQWFACPLLRQLVRRDVQAGLPVGDEGQRADDSDYRDRNHAEYQQCLENAHRV